MFWGTLLANSKASIVLKRAGHEASVIVAGDGERWLKLSTTGIFVLRGASECAFVELCTQRLRTSFLGVKGRQAQNPE
jgi:hypothetical protein